MYKTSLLGSLQKKQLEDVGSSLDSVWSYYFGSLFSIPHCFHLLIKGDNPFLIDLLWVVSELMCRYLVHSKHSLMFI